jgi:hypothetical protein
MICAHCGKPLPSANSRFCTHCGKPVAPSGPARAPRETPSAVEATRRAAGQTAQVVQSVLEDPRLRERIPGRSLALLGAGLVALAVLLSALPFFTGLDVGWSVVMLASSVLVGVRELHAAGRSLPEPVLRVARQTGHPLFLPAFTVLTCVQAFLSLRLGLVPLLWLLAAIVLVYDQRCALAALVAEQGTPSPEEARLGRWVLVGTLVCAAALFFTWGSGGGYSLGGIQPVHVREWKMDGFGREYEDHYEYRYDMWANYVPWYASSGRGRPLASVAVLALGGLVVLTRGRQARTVLPPWVLPVLAGAVTLWGMTGLASYLGPWLFLAGALLIDLAVARELMQRPRAG